MPRQSTPATAHDDGWLITPRALTSVATVVGLVYTLHAPVRYVLRVGATVDILAARVTTLEAEVDQQRGTIAAAERALSERRTLPPREPSPKPGRAAGPTPATRYSITR